MAVAARTLPLARARGRLGARLVASPAVVLGTAVLVSFVVRGVAAWFHATPVFFPDEYIYAELARSIEETGSPLIRGAAAGFPALLQPLVTAPAWLIEDVAVAYRLVQLLGALAMSLAAVPAYLLARRVGVGQGAALAGALLALAVPDLVYASWLLAEPFAYPLALGAVAAGVTALARPGARAQVAFLLLAALATFARVQFVVLPLCFVAALVVVGLRERRLRAAIREQALVLGLLALPVLAVAVGGPARALGYYRSVLDFDLSALTVLRWSGTDAMLLAYASGWVLVPGALVAVALALVRPRSRAELAFGALAGLFTAALVLEAAVYAASGGSRIQERYFFYAVPLIGVAFALYASRGWPYRVQHALLAAALVTASTRLPLAGFAAVEGKTNSPLLYATTQLERTLGDVGLASLGIAATLALLSLVVVAVSLAPRYRSAVAFGLALSLCAAASLGAVLFDSASSARVRAQVIAPVPSWVDEHRLGRVSLLVAPHADRGYVVEQLFWNRSLDALVLLPGATRIDAFAHGRVEVGSDGTLLVAGRPLAGPLLVDGHGATARLRDVEVVERSSWNTLVVPNGRPRLSLYAPGRFYDGWLGTEGAFRLWPASRGEALAGRLTFRLSLPAPEEGPALRTQLHLLLPAGLRRSVPLAEGEARRVSLTVCSPGAWRAGFEASPTRADGPRLLSVQSTPPVFRPDPAACAARP